LVGRPDPTSIVHLLAAVAMDDDDPSVSETAARTFADAPRRDRAESTPPR
jgi:hypothetical protein